MLIEKKHVIQTMKRVYQSPVVTCIKIDHEISLVMMSESTEPPPEFIGSISKTFKIFTR
jgi:hypothetical protein